MAYYKWFVTQGWSYQLLPSWDDPPSTSYKLELYPLKMTENSWGNWVYTLSSQVFSPTFFDPNNQANLAQVSSRACTGSMMVERAGSSKGNFTTHTLTPESERSSQESDMERPQQKGAPVWVGC